MRDQLSSPRLSEDEQIVRLDRLSFPFPLLSKPLEMLIPSWGVCVGGTTHILANVQHQKSKCLNELVKVNVMA